MPLICSKPLTLFCHHYSETRARRGAQLKIRGLYWEPQTGNPKNITGIYWDRRTLVSIFRLYSYYILGVPCLGFPIKSPLSKLDTSFLEGIACRKLFALPQLSSEFRARYVGFPQVVRVIQEYLDIVRDIEDT